MRAIHNGDAWHGPASRESLAGVTAAQAATRPMPEAHNISEIVAHIAVWEDVFRRRLEGDGEASEPKAGDFPAIKEASETAWRETLNALESGHEMLLSVVSQLSDEVMEQM